MKKNVLTRYKAAIIYGIFAFFIGVNIVIVATHAHAAQVDAPAMSTSTAAITGDTPTLPVVDTPTLVPVPTPTLVPTNTPIPVNTPTPVPTQPPPPPPPPAPTPTPVPVPTPKPTHQPVPPGVPTVTAPGLPPSNGGGLLPGMTPVPSPTPGTKATPRATATPTLPVLATPTVSASTSTNNSISNQGNQEGSGIGTAIVPVAIGSVLLLLIGGLTCFMFLRKPNAQQLAYAGVPLRATGRPGRFNYQDSNAPFATPIPIPAPIPAPAVEPQSAFAAASIPDVLPMSPAGPPIPMPAHTNKMVITPTSPSAFASGPQPTVTMPTGIQPDLLYPNAFGGERQPENEAYMPSDLKPITTPLPKLVSETVQRNPISTSDMNPLPLDNFDLSQVLPQGNNGPANNQMIPGPAEEPQAFSPLIAPSIQDDPVLETIMRQAQMGLYALPNQETPGSEENL